LSTGRLANAAPLRVAVVGAGGWGNQHARVFAGRQDAVLCAVVARTASRAAARAAQWSTTPYTSIETMLKREDPDLVSVCLPNEAHFEPTLELIEAGYPLLVEKPLVFDVSQGRQLLEAADQRGLFFAINFNHRFAEPVQRARLAIDTGELGPITFATWRFGGEGSNSVHPHANLIETQCHGFDLLEYLCGPIASVMAQMSTGAGGDHATLAVAIEFDQGAVGSLVGSYESSYAYPWTQVIEVNGTHGRALIEDTVRRLTLSRAGDETHRVWEAGYFNDRDREFHRTFDKHIDALIPAWRAGDEPPVPARAGLRALELADAIIRSFDTGTRISTHE
jgi:myo-inositol 2-dehydrogenase/D-chiro-inositol 1-dehydrogenase